MEEKIIIVPRARPAVDFASNLLVIPKDDFDEYVNEINSHHVKFMRSLESSWNIKADGRAIEAIKMVKEEYKKIIAKKDKEIAELKAQKAQAEDDCAYWKTMSRKCADDNEVMAKQRAEAFKRERQQKYKRCLAMARWCEYRYDNAFERILSVRDMGFQPSDELTFDLAFFKKWRKRWLEIAYKFKEAK